VAAFVNPHDRAIANVVSSATTVLDGIAPGRNFDGYGSILTHPDHPRDQIAAIYESIAGRKLRYISPPGTQLFDEDEKPSGQLVRSHNCVLDQRLGTCHDLSLLLAACAEYVRLHPLIVMIRNHTFLGYWRSVDSQRVFWKQEREELGINLCRIDNAAKLRALVRQNHVELIEATFMCEKRPYQEATAQAVKRLDEALLDDDFSTAIDIVIARRLGIQPI
jgi:hypothetical protein